MTATTYNADGQAISSTDELNDVITTVYDANGNVIRTQTPDGMITDTVYDAQGRAIYTDDPHLSGAPCDGTHTLYDQAGQVIGTERLANMVITITTSNGVSASTFTSAGRGQGASHSSRKGEQYESHKADLLSQPISVVRCAQGFLVITKPGWHAAG